MNQDSTRSKLSCYRPSGQDRDNPDFHEALEAMKHDPELAQWFQNEQAEDQLFAEQLLKETPVPKRLRNELLSIVETQDEPNLDLTEIPIPTNLRSNLQDLIDTQVKPHLNLDEIKVPANLRSELQDLINTQGEPHLDLDIPVPSTLRGDLQTIIDAQAEPHLDLQEIPVPKDLRSNILDSLAEKENPTKGTEPPTNIIRFQDYWNPLTAVAAVFIVCCLVLLQPDQENTPVVASNDNLIEPLTTELNTADPFFFTAISAIEDTPNQTFIEVTNQAAYDSWIQRFGYNQLPTEVQSNLDQSTPMGVYLVELDGEITAVFKHKSYDGQSIYLMASTKNQKDKASKKSDYKDGKWSGKRLDSKEKDIYLITEDE